MNSVSPARKAAFAILKTMEKHGHSDALLRGPNVNALSEADRNLTTALVLGVLRWQIQLDRQFKPLLKHPLAKLDPEVLIALRLGAFQLLHMDRIPARAAIDESVELTKLEGHRFASGMVNAVLRKLADPAAKEKNYYRENDCREAYPAWITERWAESYGSAAACAICDYCQQQPDLSVRLSADDAEQELAADGIEFAPGEFVTVARRVVSGDVTKTAAFLEGRVRIQDEGSQLIAELAPRGLRILDCCAAPGGKTLILAERNPQSEITACDGSHQRLAAMRKRLQGLGDRVQCRLADVTHLDDKNAFDTVLADVPCSGTGTLARNPEIRHRLRPEDLPRHAERQKAILHSALRAARPSGYVLYSTCSLEPDENEHVVSAVLSANSCGRIVPLRTRIEELRDEGIISVDGAETLLKCITAEGYLRLLPGVHRTDGFFAALIEKKP